MAYRLKSIKHATSGYLQDIGREPTASAISNFIQRGQQSLKEAGAAVNDAVKGFSHEYHPTKRYKTIRAILAVYILGDYSYELKFSLSTETGSG